MARTPDDGAKETSFEAHLEALEAVVSDLEGDSLPLEAAIERYRIGVGHLAACRRALDAAEKRLVELAGTADGTGVVEKRLEVGAEGLLLAGTGPEPAPKKARAPKPPTPPVLPPRPPSSSSSDDGDIPF